MIKTEHKGFSLQKIEVNTEARMVEDKRDWYAMYESRIHGVQQEAFGVSPEDAAQRACIRIDSYLEGLPIALATRPRFKAPIPEPNETPTGYLFRTMQALETWVNSK